MSLTNFLMINLPYGMQRQGNNSWFVFNREYKPLGYNTGEHVTYETIPIATEYKQLGPKTLLKLRGPGTDIDYGADGEIERIWFYDDGTVPTSHNRYWQSYMDRLQLLARLKVKNPIGLT